jgi:pyrroline-5-carboxylate reductase
MPFGTRPNLFRAQHVLGIHQLDMEVQRGWVVRPPQFGMGVVASGLSHEARDVAMAFLAPLGAPEWVGEELFDAVTALAGCGPAFVYRFIQALAAGGEALGLDGAQSLRLAQATVDGAAALAAASPYPPGELARRVASPGGSTQAGLDVLDADSALMKLVLATMTAARDRNVAMGAEARKA